MPLYRITVFKAPRAPWRMTVAQAMGDAIRLGLASWDESRREHFLAVPVDMEVRKPVGFVAPPYMGEVT